MDKISTENFTEILQKLFTETQHITSLLYFLFIICNYSVFYQYLTPNGAKN
jgi:hypothetical protein